MIEHRSVEGGGPKRTASRERYGVLALALGIIGALAGYLLLNSRTTGDDTRDLLPYQTLVATLPEPDQRMYRALRTGLLEAEADRARTSAWPTAEELAARGVAPFAPTDATGGYTWSRLEQGTIINYFGQPADPAAPAWLLEIQEPEPGMLPDTAPPDDEHHKLPDGTMLHLYLWTHRYGGQVPVGFVRQPQSSGWTEVFAKPPDPLFYNRR